MTHGKATFNMVRGWPFSHLLFNVLVLPVEEKENKPTRDGHTQV